jgi:tellurite resistance protein
MSRCPFPLVPATVAAALLAGCGGSPVSPSDVAHPRRALRDAAEVSAATAAASQHFMERICAKAVINDGRDLTRAEAQQCVRRLRDGYLRELRRDGYDPQAAATGGDPKVP